MLEINNPEVVAEVMAAFMRYERALVTNNIEELNVLFGRASMPCVSAFTKISTAMSRLLSFARHGRRSI